MLWRKTENERERKRKKERQRQKWSRQKQRPKQNRDAETGASLICVVFSSSHNDNSLSDYNAILRIPVMINYYVERPPSNIAIVGITTSKCESEHCLQN